MTSNHLTHNNQHCITDVIDIHLQTEKSFQSWMMIVRHESVTHGGKHCFSKLTSAESSLLREIFYMAQAINFCMRHLRVSIHIQCCCSVDLLAMYLICERGKDFYLDLDYQSAKTSYNAWLQQMNGEFKSIYYKKSNTWKECKTTKDRRDETFYLPKDFYVVPAKFSFAKVVSRLVRKKEFGPPWVNFKTEELISIKYLSTTKELKRHALAQKNCAYDYVGDILLGECQFFEMKLGERVLTVELKQDVNRRPALHECLYAENDVPEFREMETICRYLEQNGVATFLPHYFEEKIRIKRSEVRWYADMIYWHQHDTSMRESLRWDEDDVATAKRRLEIAEIELSLLQSGDPELIDLLPLEHCKKR